MKRFANRSARLCLSLQCLNQSLECDQLKLQHLQLWLSVLHNVGAESDLFVFHLGQCELRMKAVLRFAPSTWPHANVGSVESFL